MEMEKIETRLSLFAIKSDLRELVEQRCDALDRLTELQATAEPLPYFDRQTIIPEIAAVEEELAALDGLIRQYQSKEPAKIDATAHVLLELKARQQIHRAEADRLYMMATNEAATEKRIKELVLSIMDEFGEKRLRGRLHDLMAKGNGGIPALTIAQLDMVPASMKRVTVQLSEYDWQNIAKPVLDRNRYEYVVKEVEPNNSAIRAVLESSEKRRAAIQQQADEATEGSDEEKARWVSEQTAALPGVPGCRLEPRGKHLEVK